jgi:hypothetical protein
MILISLSLAVTRYCASLSDEIAIKSTGRLRSGWDRIDPSGGIQSDGDIAARSGISRVSREPTPPVPLGS